MLTSEHIVRLWQELDDLFPGLFVDRYGDKAKAWLEKLNRCRVTPPDLIRGLEALQRAGDQFPPSFPRFVALCKASNEPRTHLGPPAVEFKPNRLPPEEVATHLSRIRSKLKTPPPDPRGVTQDDRDYFLMYLLHQLRADGNPVAQRLRTIRGDV